MSKRLCSVCGTTPLHRDNTSGVCKGCKATQRVDGKSLAANDKPDADEAPAEPKKARRVSRAEKDDLIVYERTDRQPKRPFVGLNLLVVEAVERLGTEATVSKIAGHMKNRAAFEKSKQDPVKAARWHSWHLHKKGYLRFAR